MATIRLKKTDGGISYDWQVWIERSTLNKMLLVHNPKKRDPGSQEEQKFPSAAAAKVALEAFVADLRAQGFVAEGEEPVAAPAASSGPIEFELTKSEPNKRLTWYVAVEGTKLVTVLHTNAKMPVPPVRKEQPFATAAAAEEAARKFVAGVVAQGFVGEDTAPAPAAAPAADLPPSKPWKTVAKPAWLAKLPEPLSKQHQRVLQLLETARLGHRADDVESLLRLGVAFKLKAVKPAAVAGVGSRFGGDPDAPADFAWPGKKGAPLAFVAQLRLDELKAFDREKKLPAEGLLSVFAQLNCENDGYAEQVEVYLFEDLKALVRTAPRHGKDDDCRPGKVCTVEASGRLTLPAADDPAAKALKLNDEERERYADDVFGALRPSGPAQQLLGWGNASSPNAYKKGWELLLQIDTDDRLGLEIGDCETLRLHIESSKLVARDFSGARASVEEE